MAFCPWRYRIELPRLRIDGRSNLCRVLPRHSVKCPAGPCSGGSRCWKSVSVIGLEYVQAIPLQQTLWRWTKLPTNCADMVPRTARPSTSKRRWTNMTDDLNRECISLCRTRVVLLLSADPLTIGEFSLALEKLSQYEERPIS